MVENAFPRQICQYILPDLKRRLNIFVTTNHSSTLATSSSANRHMDKSIALEIYKWIYLYSNNVGKSTVEIFYSL